MYFLHWRALDLSLLLDRSFISHLLLLGVSWWSLVSSVIAIDPQVFATGFKSKRLTIQMQCIDSNVDGSVFVSMVAAVSVLWAYTTLEVHYVF